MPTLLVVDDDHNLRETLCDLLESNGYTVHAAGNGRDALNSLADHAIDLVLCDWRMPDLGGEQFLRKLAAEGTLNSMPVVIMTAFGTGPSAMQAMQLGAYDFLTKPLDMERVLSTVARALHHVRLQREVEDLRRQRFADADPDLAPLIDRDRAQVRLVGSSPAWIDVFKNVGKVAQTNVGVLLLGESGTGKEVVARAIHEHSARSREPFIIINCAALPPELLESELFGHERGAFTGAVTQKVGKFEAANRGTIFLDEIGELPLSLQPKLLRVLQEHTFERIGSSAQLATDVRILAATNRDLEKEVAAKTFRADLFYRLNTYTIHLPPLRERPGDIVPLAEYFLERYALRHGGPVQGLTEEAGRELALYNFPGNVRELEHLIERCAVKAAGRPISAEAIRAERIDQNATQAQGLSLTSLLQLPFHEAIGALERRLLQNAMQLSSQNKSEAARRLGIHRRLLYEKLEQYGISGDMR